MLTDTSYSVVLPVHNARSFVGAALDSVINQTMPPSEIIVIDDASSDGSEEILRRYSHSGLQLISNNVRLGIVESLNRGIKACRYEFIGLMHADDIAVESRFAEQVTYLAAHSQVGVLGTGIELIGDWQGTRLYPAGDARIRAELLFDSAFCHSSVMFRSSHLNRYQLEYRNGRLGVEDYTLWTEVPPGCEMANLPVVLQQYRVHATQTSAVKRNELMRNADEIRRNQLVAFGIAPNDEELHLHSAIARRDFTRSLEFLDHSDTWLTRLLEHNYARVLHDHGAFSDVVSDIWFDLCLRSAALGTAVLDRFEKSAIVANQPLLIDQVARLLLQCKQS